MASKMMKKVSLPSVKNSAAKGSAQAQSVKTARTSASAESRPKKATRVQAHAKAEATARKPSAKATASHVSRRDGTGHLDATYAADLHARSVASAEDHTTDRAFLRQSNLLQAPLAEELGREAVMTMTSGEDQSDQLQDVELELDEESGGPFVRTTAGQEFAKGSDRSNPRGATREPFPKS